MESSVQIVQRNERIDWFNTSFLIGLPVIALFGTAAYVYFNGIHWPEMIALAIFYWISGLGITMGYHRLFTHKAYEARPVVKLLLLIAGATAFQNSALKWTSDHRFHHKHTDHEEDPYNAQRGFWYSHIGWIFFKEPDTRLLDNVPDLEKDPLVMWQHRYYVSIAGFFGWTLPTIIGAFYGRPVAFLLWAGIVRTVLVHHNTFFINSLAHICGRQTYDDRTSARDSWWLAIFTFGEGFHNFHHRFQADYRNGVRWFHWDPSKWGIRLLSFFGLTQELRRTSPEVIFTKRLEMDLKRVSSRLAATCTQSRFLELSHDLEMRRLAVLMAWKRWKDSLATYAKAKRELADLTAFKAEIRRQKESFQESLHSWREMIRIYSAGFSPSLG